MSAQRRDGAQAARDAAVLAARARELARPPLAPPPSDVVDMVRFQLAGEQFAIANAHVREVFSPEHVTMLPRAESPAVALTLWRGDLLLLLDVRRMMRLVESGAAPRRVIVVEARERRAGVLVDEVTGIETIRPGLVQPPTGDRQSHLKGVTPMAVSVLEPAALLGTLE